MIEQIKSVDYVSRDVEFIENLLLGFLMKP